MPNDLQLSDQDEVLLESLVLAASDNVARAPASDRDQFAPERRRAFVETSGNENVYLGTGSTWVDVSENTGLLSKLFSGGDGNFDSVNTGELRNIADHVVDSTSKLESAFNNLSAGDTVWIGSPETPYRTTQWLDIDADGVTVIGQSRYAANGDPLIKVADGANVGGLRIGNTTQVRGVTVSSVGYDGNRANQDSGVKRLHGIIIADAADTTVKGCRIEYTSPTEHGGGGSAVSIRHQAVDTTVRDCHWDNVGDRGCQDAGLRTEVVGCRGTNGYDRHCSANVTEPDGTVYHARKAEYHNNIFGASSDGSVFGVGGAASNFPSDNDVDISIHDNKAFGDHKHFFHVSGPSGTHVEGVSVQANTARQTASQEYSAISIDSGGTAKNIRTKNNEFVGYSGAGWKITTDPTTVADIVSEGDTVRDCTNAGFLLQNASDVTVRDATVLDAGGIGVSVESSVSDFEIGGTVKRAAKNGVFCNGADGHVDVALKSNNQGENSIPEAQTGGSNVTYELYVIDRNGSVSVFEDNTATNVVYQNCRFPDDGNAWNYNSLDPTSVTRHNTPAVDDHSGVTASSSVASVTFDRTYASRPRLAFGRRGGGVGSVTFNTDGSGNYSGVDVSVTNSTGTIDVAVVE